MQDETQVASATSSPDPLSLMGPEDRDIDVFHFLPRSVCSCAAYRQSQPDVFRVPPVPGLRGILLMLASAVGGLRQEKQETDDSGATGDSAVFEEPERQSFSGLANEASPWG
jgi:hypothetical protein